MYQFPLHQTVLWMVLINAFTTPLMLSAVIVALPAIANDLQFDAVLLSWIPMAYLMASAMFVLIFGRIADMYGRKLVFLTGTFLVIVFSIAAACSQTGETLVFWRFMQGLSAAMLYATQIAIISSVCPPAQRGRAIGLMISSLYLGLTCGPAIGGFLVSEFGWRSSFLFHIPLAFIVLFIGLTRVDKEWKADDRGELDLMGALVYASSILALVFGVSFFPEPRAMVLLGVSVVGIYIFLYIEKRVQHPIFNSRLLLSNSIFSMSCIASYIMYAATFANVVLVSLYLQYLKGFSAHTAGLIMMIQPLVMAMLAPLAGHISDKIEPRIIASLGMSVTTAGLIMMTQLSVGSSVQFLVIALILTGIGFSLFSSPNTNAIMSSVEKHQYGTAAGVNATMRILGQMSSMVIVTLMMSLYIGQVEIQSENYTELEKVIRNTFMFGAILCIPGIYLSLSRGRMHD